MKNRISLPLRLTSLVVLSAFLVSELAHAAEGVFLSGASVPSASAAAVPADAATVDGEAVFSDSARKIWIVRDAHTNESGQLNIAKTLEHLSKTRGLRVVFLEGADGDVSLDDFKNGVPFVRRRTVGLAYVKKGWLQGAEYWNLTSAESGTLWGVEDPALYEEALKIYAETAGRRADASRALDKIDRTIAELKRKIYSPAFADFDARRTAFARGTEKFADYAEALFTAARAAGLSPEESAHIGRLIELGRLEKQVDFEAANRQLREAAAVLGPDDRAAFERAGEAAFEAFRIGEAAGPAASFHALIERKLPAADGRYPALRRYWEYLREAARLDAKTLTEEISSLENKVAGALAVGDAEKRLASAAERAKILRSVLAMRSGSAGFSVYRADPDAHSSLAIGAALNRLILELGASHENAVFYDERLDEAARLAARFYELTYARDEAFVERALIRMEQSGAAEAALVAGGYHSENLKALFAAKNISYTVVTPRVLHPTDEARYEKLLLEDLNPRAAAAMPALAADRMSVRPLVQGARADGPKRERALRLAEDLNVSDDAVARAFGSRGTGPEDPIERMNRMLEGIDALLEGTAAPAPLRRNAHRLRGAHALVVVDAAGEPAAETREITDPERDFRGADSITVESGLYPSVVVRWGRLTRVYDTHDGTFSESVRISFAGQILAVGRSMFVTPAASAWRAMPENLRKAIVVGALVTGLVFVIGYGVHIGFKKWDEHRASVAAAAAEKAEAEKTALEKEAEAERKAKAEARRTAAEAAAERKRAAAVEAAEEKAEAERNLEARKAALLAEIEKVRADRRDAISRLEEAGRSMIAEDREGNRMSVPERFDGVRLVSNLEESERLAAYAQIDGLQENDLVYVFEKGAESEYYKIVSLPRGEAAGLTPGAAYEMTSKRLIALRAERESIDDAAQRALNRLDAPGAEDARMAFRQRLPLMEYGMVPAGDAREIRAVTEAEALNGRWTRAKDGAMSLVTPSGERLKVVPGRKTAQIYWDQQRKEFVPTKEESEAARSLAETIKFRSENDAAALETAIRAAEDRAAQIVRELRQSSPELADEIEKEEKRRAEIELKLAGLRKDAAEKTAERDAARKNYEKWAAGYGYALDGDETVEVRLNGEAANLRFFRDLLPEERRAYEEKNGAAQPFDAVLRRNGRVLKMEHLTKAGAEALASNDRAAADWNRRHSELLAIVRGKAEDAERKIWEAKKSGDKKARRQYENLLHALQYDGILYDRAGNGKVYRSGENDGASYYLFGGQVYVVKLNGQWGRLQPGTELLKRLKKDFDAGFEANAGRLVPELAEAHERAERRAMTAGTDEGFELWKNALDVFLKKASAEKRKAAVAETPAARRLAQIEAEADAAYRAEYGRIAGELSGRFAVTSSRVRSSGEVAGEKAAAAVRKEYRNEITDLAYSDDLFEWDGTKSEHVSYRNFFETRFLGDLSDAELAEGGASRIEGDPSRIRVPAPGKPGKFFTVSENTPVQLVEEQKGGPKRFLRVRLGLNHVDEFWAAWLARRIGDEASKPLIEQWRREMIAKSAEPVREAMTAYSKAAEAVSDVETEIRKLESELKENALEGRTAVELAAARQKLLENAQKTFRAAVLTWAQTADKGGNKLYGPTNLDETVLVITDYTETSPQLLAYASQATGLPKETIVEKLLNGDDPVFVATMLRLQNLTMNGGDIASFNRGHGEWFSSRLTGVTDYRRATLRELIGEKGGAGESFGYRLRENGGLSETYAERTAEGHVRFGRRNYMLHGYFSIDGPNPAENMTALQTVERNKQRDKYILVDLSSDWRIVRSFKNLEEYRTHARAQERWTANASDVRFDGPLGTIPGMPELKLIEREEGEGIAHDRSYVVTNYDPAVRVAVLGTSDMVEEQKGADASDERLLQKGFITENQMNRSMPPERKIEVKQNEFGEWETHAPLSASADGFSRENPIVRVYDYRTGDNVLLGTRDLPYKRTRNDEPLRAATYQNGFNAERGMIQGFAMQGPHVILRMDSGDLLARNPLAANVFREQGKAVDAGRLYYLEMVGHDLSNVVFPSDRARAAEQLIWRPEPSLIPPDLIAEPERSPLPPWIEELKALDDEYWREEHPSLDARLGGYAQGLDDAREAWLRSYMYDGGIKLNINEHRRIIDAELMRLAGMNRFDLACGTAGPEAASKMFDRALEVYGATLKRTDYELARWAAEVQEIRRHVEADMRFARIAETRAEQRATARMMASKIDERLELLSVPRDIVAVFTEDQSGMFDVLTEESENDFERKARAIAEWHLDRERKKTEPDPARIAHLSDLIVQIASTKRRTPELEEHRARRLVRETAMQRQFLGGEYGLMTAKLTLDKLQAALERAREAGDAQRVRAIMNAAAALESKLASAKSEEMQTEKSRLPLSFYEKERLRTEGHVDWLAEEILANPEARQKLIGREQQVLADLTWRGQVDNKRHQIYPGFTPTLGQLLDFDREKGLVTDMEEVMRFLAFPERAPETPQADGEKAPEIQVQDKQGSRADLSRRSVLWLMAGGIASTVIDGAAAEERIAPEDLEVPEERVGDDDPRMAELARRIEGLAREFPIMNFDDLYGVGDRAMRDERTVEAVLAAVQSIGDALRIAHRIRGTGSSVLENKFGTAVQTRFFARLTENGNLRIIAPAGSDPIDIAEAGWGDALRRALLARLLTYDALPPELRRDWHHLSRGPDYASPGPLFASYVEEIVLGVSVDRGPLTGVQAALDRNRKRFVRDLLEDPAKAAVTPFEALPEIGMLGATLGPVFALALGANAVLRMSDRAAAQRASYVPGPRAALAGVAAFGPDTAPRWSDYLQDNFWLGVPQVPGMASNRDRSARSRLAELQARDIRLAAHGSISPGALTLAPLGSFWPLLRGKRSVSVSYEPAASGSAAAYVHVDGRHALTVKDARAEFSALNAVTKIYVRRFVSNAPASTPYRAEILSAIDAKPASVAKTTLVRRLGSGAAALLGSAVWIALLPLVTLKSLMAFGALEWTMIVPAFAAMILWDAFAGRDLAAWLPFSAPRERASSGGGDELPESETAPAATAAPSAPDGRAAGQPTLASEEFVQSLKPFVALAVPQAAGDSAAFAIEGDGRAVLVESAADAARTVTRVIERAPADGADRARIFSGQIVIDADERATIVGARRAEERLKRESGQAAREREAREIGAARERQAREIIAAAGDAYDRMPPTTLRFDLADAARGADAERLRVKLDFFYADMILTAGWAHASGLPLRVEVRGAEALAAYELEGAAQRMIQKLGERFPQVFASKPGEGNVDVIVTSDEAKTDASRLNVGYRDAPVGSYFAAAALGAAMAPIAAGKSNADGSVDWDRIGPESVTDGQKAAYDRMTGETTSAGDIVGALSVRAIDAFRKLMLPVPGAALEAAFDRLRLAAKFVLTSA